MQYYVVRHDGKKYSEVDNKKLWPTGTAAKTRAAQLTQQFGIKHSVRPFEDEDWRPKIKIPKQHSFKECLPGHYWINPIPDHFCHASPEEAGMIKYFETPLKGAAQQWTTTTLARYLTEFYMEGGLYHTIYAKGNGKRWNNKDFLSSIEIRDIDIAFKAEWTQQEIFWAVTPEEIEHVFRTGPYSCATWSEWPKYTGGIYELKGVDPSVPHPAQVYAGGDIHIAYLKSGDRITARANVYRKKKLVAGVYGDTSRLTKNLIRQGYTILNYGQGQKEFAGARLKKIVDPTSKFYIGVHIDNFPRCRDAGDHLVVDPNGTFGFTSGNPRAFIIGSSKEAVCGDKAA